MNLGKLGTESKRKNIKSKEKWKIGDRSGRSKVNQRKGIRKAEAEDNSGEYNSEDIYFHIWKYSN